jgi:hypothetical protein
MKLVRIKKQTGRTSFFGNHHIRGKNSPTIGVVKVDRVYISHTTLLRTLKLLKTLIKEPEE